MLTINSINQGNGNPLDMRDVDIDPPGTWSGNVAELCLCILMNAVGKTVKMEIWGEIAILLVLLICVHV